MVSFGEALQRCLAEHYFDVNGRATRAEFWWFQLFYFICIFLCVYVTLFFEYIPGTMGRMIFLALILPDFSVTIRRLHDVSLSGWFALLYFVPYAMEFFNLIPDDYKLAFYVFYMIVSIALVVVAVLPSSQENQWGPNPFDEEEQESEEQTEQETSSKTQCMYCGYTLQDSDSYCKQCGKQITCSHCGSLLAKDAAFCSHCGKELTSNAAFCSKCGNALTANALFCSRCGNKV